MTNRVIPLEVKGTVRTNINGKRRRTVEEHEKYVDMQNACHKSRCEKNKTISYFTGFDDGFEQAKKQLTEAKDIIKDLLNLPFANNEEVYADVTSHLDRAKQFLNDEVKE